MESKRSFSCYNKWQYLILEFMSDRVLWARKKIFWQVNFNWKTVHFEDRLLHIWHDRLKKWPEEKIEEI